MVQENVCVYTILLLYYLYGSCSRGKSRLMNVVLKLNRQAERICFIFGLHVVKCFMCICTVNWCFLSFFLFPKFGKK